MKSRLIAFLSVATLFAAVPVAASASTTIGQNPAPGTALTCTADSGHVVSTQASMASNPYVAPAGGVITGWGFQAGAGGGTLALQVLLPDAVNGTFTPLAESAVETPTASILNKFQTRIPVAAGQEIGLRVVTGSPDCRYSAPGLGFTEFSASPAPLPGGGPKMYPAGTADLAVNATATIEPDADGDGYGDETQDGCPNNATRQDDCVKPSVKIDSGPQAKTKSKSANFTFSSDDSKATFECRLDSASFSSCTSPLALKKLKKGKHTFEVRATDLNGNTSATETYKWKVKKKKHHHKH